MRAMIFLTLVLSTASTGAAEKYQKPPKEILEVLDAPAPPIASVSPAGDAMLLLDPRQYPAIAELAEPMLRLAGSRVNPKTNGPHRPPSLTGLALKRLADGSETKIVLPPGVRLGAPEWSPDGRWFAFTNTHSSGIELWIGETASGRARKLPGVALNAAFGDPMAWMPDSRMLLVKTIPAGRGAPPAAPRVPDGPNVQESEGRGAPTWTLQDLLKTPHDEALYEYYAMSQLALVDVAGGKATPLGRPAIFQTAQPAPDGRHMLVARVRRPFSYLHSDSSFPKEVELWDSAARVVHKLASLPLADAVPVDGVPTGPRRYEWRPTEPATLVWTEALDGGDPKTKVPHRDRILILKAPFSGTPVELLRTEQRSVGIQWGERGSFALARDFDRARRWMRTFAINPDRPQDAPRLIWSRDTRDRYRDPGSPVTRVLPNAHTVVRQNGDAIFLIGDGSSRDGDRPFLDRFDMVALKPTRLFQSDADRYEGPVALLDDDSTRFITRHESPSEPPNYFVRTLSAGSGAGGNGDRRALTRFADPTPQLRGITRRRVTYKRADGVALSFTLFLPPGYKEGTRLPTVMWSYPLEFGDADTAGQVSGSLQRFIRIAGTSHLFFLLRGYAVLDNATLPVVGDFQTANNTYLDQIVTGAKAAIDKAAEIGVTDPKRVGVGGHSYGGFMTANLLAHSDLFRAGIARSGAYNRTLTPFGFQSERRTLWEAPDVYLRMSPFMSANKINEPILLIHGEMDNNAGTHPIQSDRLYQAIRGNRGTVRYVTLPLESHGYSARESVEHTIYEMLTWFDKHVKHDPVAR